MFCFLCPFALSANRTAKSVFDECSKVQDLTISGSMDLNDIFTPEVLFYYNKMSANSPKCFRISKGFIIGLSGNDGNAQVDIVGRDKDGNTFSASANDKPFGAACPNDGTCEYVITSTGRTNYFIAYGISTLHTIQTNNYYGNSVRYR